jgi:glycosyltransferase involved in cell wall biosynthesis
LAAASQAASLSPSLRHRRILFVLGTFDMGGAERQALLLARGLSEQCQAQVELWGIHDGDAVPRYCAKYGLPWRTFQPPWIGGRVLSVRLLATLAIALRRWRPDVVLAYTHQANVACGLVCGLAGVRHLVWGQRDSGIRQSRRLTQVVAVRGASRFVSNSAPGVDFLARQLRVPRSKIDLIPNGVVLEAPQHSRTVWRDQLRLLPDSLAVCMVGNLSQLKDHATLLEAWRLVLDRWAGGSPVPSLILAGRPDDRSADVQRRIDTLRLQSAVRLPGYVEDIPGLLQACDLAVFSSRAEGLPNGVLEPMACGLALVATDLPGTRAALEATQPEWLVPAGDVAAMATSLDALLQAPELRRRQGEANRAFVTAQYGASALVERYAALLTRELSAANG